MSRTTDLIKHLTILELEEFNVFVINLIKVIKEPVTLGFLNQHGFNLIMKSEAISKSFYDLDYVFRDGSGVKLACKYKGLRAGANLNGTDFIPQIIKLINEFTTPLYFVLGTENPWLAKGSRNLIGHQKIYTLDGFQPISSYIDLVTTKLVTEVDHGKLPIILLAMGMPKQEVVAAELKKIIKQPCLIICGGAIVDFKAGKFRRAPHWMRDYGLEWFFRLVKEPHRLFKRYVIGIPLFIFYILFNF
jgi:hypothetical protein